MPKSSPAKLDLTNQKIGRLTVLQKIPPDQKHKNHWLCRCECGTERSVFLGHLRSGNTSSCGCLRDEMRSARPIKHGHSVGGKTTKTFETFRSMHRRCSMPSQGGYMNYGGRGIKVCDRWSGSEGFSNFLTDMGEKPDGLTIERVDPDGNYSPDNCCWIPAAAQARNKRGVDLIDGTPKTLWAEARGICLSVAYRRAKRTGLPVLDVIKQMGGADA